MSLGAVGALGLAFLFLGTEGGPTVCLFRLTVGLPCPGCGLTRASVHLLHGDLWTSLRVHPFAALLALEAVAVWALIGYRVHRDLPIGLPRGVETLVLGQVAALLAFWLGRLASGTAPF